MTLRETLEKLRENTQDDAKFEALIEGMKRRADKGMIPGVSSKNITECLSEIEKEKTRPESLSEKEELISMIAELNEACNKYSYLSEEYEIDDETMNNIALYEFYEKLNEVYGDSLGDKWHDYKNSVKDWAEENPGKAAGVGAGVGAVGTAAATTPFIVDATKRSALRSKYIEDSLRNGSKLTSSELASEFNAANPSLLKRIGSKLAVGSGKVVNWFSAHPYLGAGLAGAAAVGVGSLLALAIRKARRKRQAMLKENLENIIIFNEETLFEIREILNDVPDTILESIIYNSNELVQELIFEAYEFSAPISESETLTEAVTYINNCGELKTKSAVEYVADMHKYDGREPIKKYDKKTLKKREYKLLDENLDSFKKLSEMSLEEILAEAEKL